jgi:hypothetical protein
LSEPINFNANTGSLKKENEKMSEFLKGMKSTEMQFSTIVKHATSSWFDELETGVDRGSQSKKRCNSETVWKEMRNN